MIFNENNTLSIKLNQVHRIVYLRFATTFVDVSFRNEILQYRVKSSKGNYSSNHVMNSLKETVLDKYDEINLTLTVTFYLNYTSII